MFTYKIEDQPSYTDCILIDVRSEGEYEEGHVPGAINLPILNNMERSEVGTLYSKVSVEAAQMRGFMYGSAKMGDLIQTINRILKNAGEKKVVMYCSRGGYRSKSLVSLLNSVDINVYQLEGGYKAYRNYVLQVLQQRPLPKMIALQGMTGSGKTKILHILREHNIPVLDLEGAANHRGSLLGAIGTNRTQSSQMFENAIVYQLDKFAKSAEVVVTEMESKKIGKLLLPKRIYDSYSAPQNQLVVHIPFEERVRHLVTEYAEALNFHEEFETALEKLRYYISNDVANEILEAYKSKDYDKVTRLLLLHHYDPLYQKGIREGAHYIYGDTAQDVAKQIIDLGINAFFR